MFFPIFVAASFLSQRCQGITLPRSSPTAPATGFDFIDDTWNNSDVSDFCEKIDWDCIEIGKDLGEVRYVFDDWDF